MTKKGIAGYTLLNTVSLKEIAFDIKDNVPMLSFEDRCWFLFNKNSVENGIDVVTTPYGRFKAIPTLTSYSDKYLLTTLNVGSSTYVLDLATVSIYIELNLQTNIKLELINFNKNRKYFIKINLNGFTIENLLDIAAFPTTTATSVINNNYSDFILKLENINEVKGEILFTLPANNFSLLNYAANTVNIELNTLLYDSATDTAGTTFTTEGDFVFQDNCLRLNNGRILYNSNIDFNETNFSIEFFYQLLTFSDSGSIVSKWSDNSKQFFIRVENGTLKASFAYSSTLIELSAAINTSNFDFNHVIINRFGNVYRMFINGALADFEIAGNNFNNFSTAKLILGRLENATEEGSIAATSFAGRISQLNICTSARHAYSFNKPTPKDRYFNNVNLLYRFDLPLAEGIDDLSNYSVDVALESLSSPTYPWLESNQRNGNPSLSRYHHFEVAGSDLNILASENFTAEAWIKNPSGNTRATIFHYGPNWHFGIYDGNLRLDIGASILNGTAVPYDQFVHVAFTKLGNAYTLFINRSPVATSTIATSFITDANTYFGIKRAITQDDAIASVNTTLYPSRSHLLIDSLRLTKGIARYSAIFNEGEYFGLS